MIKRYALIFLVAAAALTAYNPGIQKYISALIEIVKSIPVDGEPVTHE